MAEPRRLRQAWPRWLLALLLGGRAPGQAALAVPPGVELFFSAYSGYADNRYLQLYNAGNVTVDLSEFTYPNSANQVDVPGEPEYFNKFKQGATLRPGEVYTIAHPNADQSILSQADETCSYLSDRNDGFAVVYGNESGYVILDIVGTFLGDGMRGWDVCGFAQATDHQTLLRKESTTQGNRGDWTKSAGKNAENCEWFVFDPDNTSNLHVWGEVWGVKSLPGTSTTSTSKLETSSTSTVTSIGGSAGKTQGPGGSGGGMEVGDVLVSSGAATLAPTSPSAPAWVLAALAYLLA